MQKMDEIKLSLSQAGQGGEISIVRVDGVVDTITASELENVVEKLTGQKRFKIIIDLGGVEYISSAGWGIFVSKIQEIRDNGGDLKLVNMIPNVSEIYELLEFEHIIQAFDTLEQGKKAFKVVSSALGEGEQVWKAEEKIVAESGSAIQSAFSPGIRNKSSGDASGEGFFAHPPRNDEAVILQLVAEDPFGTIGELSRQATELSGQRKLGWWQVFGILRRNGLLRIRSRYRYARKHSKR
jgi:anti-sigma B factor antagonist